MSLALFAFANLKHDLGLVWTWLCHRSFWQLAFGAMAIFALIQHFTIAGERRHSAKLQSQLTAVTKARADDRRAYQQAQADAQAKNRSDVAKIEQKQKDISDATVSDLNSKLVRLRRELRNNPTAKGSAGSTPLPETGPTPCRAYDPAWLCLSPDDRLRATENEQRHDSLIDWNERQSKVIPEGWPGS